MQQYESKNVMKKNAKKTAQKKANEFSRRTTATQVENWLILFAVDYIKIVDLMSCECWV
jgi:hypothetical protein